jgi:channel protein (hemolysin III family)
VHPLPGIADPFSSLSHFAGAAVFLLLTPCLLLRGRGQTTRVVALAIFSASVLLVLGTSGVYHLLDPRQEARSLWQRLDHAAIFVLIAASFTPVHWILFQGIERWGVLAGIWSVAAAAIVFKATFFQSMPEAVSTGIYLGMGWLGLGSGVLLARRYGVPFVQPMLWGGLAYTSGAVLELVRWPVVVRGVIEAHEVFHVAVLMGIAWHWAFIYSIADGKVAARNLAA